MIQQALGELIQDALKDATGPTVVEQLFVPQEPRSRGLLAEQINEALEQIGETPLVEMPTANPTAKPLPDKVCARTGRHSAAALPDPDSQPRYCPPLLLTLCWLGAARLLPLCDPSRFDPAWLLLPQLPSRRTFTRWTLAYFKIWLVEHYGVDLSEETIRQSLLRLGLSWKKARKLLAKADTQQRQAYLAQLPLLLTAAHQGTLNLVFIDEAHIHLDTDLGYGWAQQGRPFLVHSSSPGLQRVSFYGLYLLTYQAVRIWPASCANGDYTIATLERLRQQFPQDDIAVIWDGASYHRSLVVIEAAARLNIRLIKLPAYSPDFMPVESLWRWLRQLVTAHHCHESVADLIRRVAAFTQMINLDPTVLATRFLVRSHLDPSEEKLRLSNWT